MIRQGLWRLAVLVGALTMTAMPTAAAEPVETIQDLGRSATNVSEWLAQIAADRVQVTGVKLNPTELQAGI
ncbi:MAG: hypothetical protein KME35_24590 [Aphanocapsa sp. GSE-SYN-MK-11-07L]|jgi:hypothetical protein|nr:hypothetical protein [Aphanocapsa sp. GSE-SYN-MK-11-07L]